MCIQRKRHLHDFLIRPLTVLRRGGKSVALSSLSTYYTCKNLKSSYRNIQFTMPAPSWNDEFELPDGSYSISDIQDHLE